MSQDTSTGILFGRTYRLTDGGQYRFRLAGPGDQLGVSALLARLGADVDELGLGRLFRADPREHAVVCATSLIAGRETIIGFAAASFAAEAQAGDRSLVAICREAGPEPRALLVQALVSRLSLTSRAA